MRILLLFYNPILQIITLQCVGGYKQKTPLLGVAIIRLIWLPELLQMERAFAVHILWL